MGYYIPCDTCDSKNAKTLDRSVRVRARERVFIGIFTIPMFPFLFLFQSKGFLGFSPFIENNTSVSTKQHVSFNKTTRRFQQNNTSFSTTQRVVFREKCRNRQRGAEKESTQAQTIFFHSVREILQIGFEAQKHTLHLGRILTGKIMFQIGIGRFVVEA